MVTIIDNSVTPLLNESSSDCYREHHVANIQTFNELLAQSESRDTGNSLRSIRDYSVNLGIGLSGILSSIFIQLANNAKFTDDEKRNIYLPNSPFVEQLPENCIDHSSVILAEEVDGTRVEVSLFAELDRDNILTRTYKSTYSWLFRDGIIPNYHGRFLVDVYIDRTSAPKLSRLLDRKTSFAGNASFMQQAKQLDKNIWLKFWSISSKLFYYILSPCAETGGYHLSVTMCTDDLTKTGIAVPNLVFLKSK